ncbi:hypothetical protein JAAARDRAFT_196936 [Jaapia argillacea MUCL 33604]|uniref:Ribonuclease H1 N-terminal domain-containing protein n=1 Tax=Jaapia argillacea MUCL 33604 TaxID=933084 RepID=A0A067PHC2_9AGAM|nr:hypothetical protein JAAARDRAFT_196936 [Jaapia argillacea MUCL 33604]
MAQQKAIERNASDVPKNIPPPIPWSTRPKNPAAYTRLPLPLPESNPSSISTERASTLPPPVPPKPIEYYHSLVVETHPHDFAIEAITQVLTSLIEATTALRITNTSPVTTSHSDVFSTPHVVDIQPPPYPGTPVTAPTKLNSEAIATPAQPSSASSSTARVVSTPSPFATPLRTPKDRHPTPCPRSTPRTPRRGSKHYTVVKGLGVGVFLDWGKVGSLVLGVSGAVYKGYNSKELAEVAFNSSLADGDVAVLGKGGEVIWVVSEDDLGDLE